MRFRMRKRLGPVLIARSWSDQGKTFVEARSDNHAENDYDNSHDLHETLTSWYSRCNTDCGDSDDTDNGHLMFPFRN
jgi:hypothetical protein